MQTRRWTNASQPQTLQMAVILLYINAAFSILFGFGAILFAIGLANVAAGYGIANERKWGYALGVVVAGLRVALLVMGAVAGGITLGLLLNAMFPVALLALLIHPQSRDYQRIWFQ